MSHAVVDFAAFDRKVFSLALACVSNWFLPSRCHLLHLGFRDVQAVYTSD
jgi:hypothetical protein